MQFVDEAVIEVSSGKGGNGCVAFRREKYIPRGGPNGGDGGKGGNVIFCVKRNMKTLAKLRYKRVFKARNGADGSSWNKTGEDGEDVVIAVPPGTSVYDEESGELIKDFPLDGVEECFSFLQGGKGGWGNTHFKSSTNQAPRYAHEGTLGESRTLRLELSIIADVGLVGFPNSGKSSLLRAFTRSKAKVASYPFTTLIPNLGVLHVDEDDDVVIADIPGIIEGASEGVGLGIDFLKHISRTKCLLFMIDASASNAKNAYKILKEELKNYSASLLSKPEIVVLNKIDIEGVSETAGEISAFLSDTEKGIKVLKVSVLTGKGLANLKSAIIEMVRDEEEMRSEERKEENSFVSSRSSVDEMKVQFPGDEG